MNQTNRHNSTVATRCQSAAHNLSYNGSQQESAAKHALVEASRALDHTSVRVHKKKDGLLLVDARGKSRFMTWKERIAYWILGNSVTIVV